MRAAHGPEWLWDDALLLIERQPGQREDAEEELRRENKDITPGRVVAALTFSFWTSMFAPEYEDKWQKTLHQIAKRKDGKGLRRKDFSGPLWPIRTLRNRIAHHEPILPWNLPKHYGNMVQLIEWLSPDAATWCRRVSRFKRIYPKERIELQGQ